MALDSIIVLDFSSGIAGPFATMFLTDHGATVIKIEPPEGDAFRTEPGFHTINRAKKSCVVDFTAPSAKETIAKLVKRADVVVVDVTQQDAANVGLDYESLKLVNPRIIYLALPPYGEKGPLVGRPASPHLINAAVGMMGHQISYSGNPVYLQLPLSAYGTAPIAAAAVSAALFVRQKAGIGQMVEVSQFAGAMALLMGADRKMVNPHPMGSKGPIPPYRLYEAADGKWFFLACANEMFYNNMLRALNLDNLIGDQRLDRAWVFGNQTQEIRDILVPILESTFKTQPRSHWLTVLREADVPAQPVLTRDEFFESEFVKTNNMRVTVDHPDLGEIDMIGVPIVLQETPGSVPRTAYAPRLGEHTSEILQFVESSENTAKSVTTTKPPEHMLSGIKVIDLAAYIAGPLGSRHLAMLGAEVLKVEPPQGDAFRNHDGFRDFNQGKRSIVLNLRTQKAKKILYDLVREYDVVIENFRPDVTKRLGIDYETLKQYNPRLIYVSSPGYGDYEAMIRAPAFDPLLQALSGVMLAQGGVEPAIHTIPLNDVMTPAIYTFGVCAALYHREVTGKGQRIRVALARSCLAIQATEFTRIKSLPTDQTSAGAVDCSGVDAGRRWYGCSDGQQLYVEAVTDDKRLALLQALGLSDVVSVDDVKASVDGAAYSALQQTFTSKPIADWLSILDAAGVPANAITPMFGEWSHEHNVVNEIIVEQEGRMQIGMLVKASATPGSITLVAPGLGEHTRQVLTDLGYTVEEQQQLIADGDVIAM